MTTVAKNKPSPTPFARRLRSLREASGFTQKEVAAQVEITEQTYIRWEQGLSEPSFSELCVIASMFGVTPNDFAPSEGEAQG
jgi:transcriptional regulator with XRE-family HTH domain